MAENIGVAIGRKLKKRRLELEFTQNFVCERLFISQNSLSLIECGKAGISIDRLISLATLLKVDLNYFMQIEYIDEKKQRILELEILLEKYEKRNEILERYIIALEKEQEKIEQHNNT